jgi:hypothetical protein
LSYLNTLLHSHMNVRTSLLPKGQPVIRHKLDRLPDQHSQTFGEASEPRRVEGLEPFSQDVDEAG